MRYEDWKKKYVDGSKLLIQDVTKRECNAMVEYNTEQIKMLDGGNIGEGNKAKLLMHEIVHAILFERGLTEHAGDEELVSEFAAGFVNLVRANPQLMEFLQG